jgi:hypothetical protein
MPIDPNIALGFRNPQIQVQNPITQYAQAQDLSLNALKMQEAKQGMETTNKQGLDLLKKAVEKEG